MDSTLVSQVVPVVGTAAGALLGGVMTYAATVRQKRIDFQVAERQVQAQVEIAGHQLQGQIAAERVREHRRKMEEAYARLGEWLYELERIIDDVWSGACGHDDELTARVERILDNWPWETVYPPKDTAPLQFYWGDEVRHFLASFQLESVSFTGSARIALASKSEPEYRGRTDRPGLDETWASRLKMFELIRICRDEARQTLTPTEVGMQPRLRLSPMVEASQHDQAVRGKGP